MFNVLRNWKKYKNYFVFHELTEIQRKEIITLKEIIKTKDLIIEEKEKIIQLINKK